MIKLDTPASIDAASLLALLREKERVKIDGWSITLTKGEQEIWLSNPYGVDCGFYAAAEVSCATLLERIANDDHEREWGSI